MKRKLLSSLLMVGLVAGLVGLATNALFSDTETSTGNTFTTGTIDIAVDDQNPWERSEPLTLQDMKPSQTGYLTFVVHNVGSNPANLWKTLSNFQHPADTVITEPECEAEHGTWTGGQCGGTAWVPVSTVESQIKYDMRVELYTEDPEGDGQAKPVWWETIYMDEDGFTLNELGEMYLGMVPADWYMKVIQSYHMDKDAGNEYQGDSLSFDIKLYAEQLDRAVALVHKYEADTDVSHHVWDPARSALFHYKIKDDELRWDLTTTNVEAGTYTLLVWDDSKVTPYSWDWSERTDAKVLAYINTNGNDVTTGSYNPGGDIINAKVWLVPGTHGTLYGSAGSFPWNATGTYFETGLIDFYDSL